jgi:recombinational DNA repair protein RecR
MKFVKWLLSVREGYWLCSKCGNLVLIGKNKCERCQHVRDNSDVVG